MKVGFTQEWGMELAMQIYRKRSPGREVKSTWDGTGILNSSKVECDIKQDERASQGPDYG